MGAQLEQRADTGPLIINHLICSEVCVGFLTIEKPEAFLDPAIFIREPLPYGAGFLTSKAFLLTGKEGAEELLPCRIFILVPTPQ